MNKKEFLDSLKIGLSGLPENDLEERLNFYSEMIDDLMEDGLSEEDAIKKIGSPEQIISQIISDTPLPKLIKGKFNRRITVIEIILLILGSPIWLSLIIAAVSIVLSIYITLWSVIISIWAVSISLLACSVGGLLGSIFFFAKANTLTAFAIIGASLVLAGLSIFAFWGCKVATKSTFILTKKIAISIKKCFVIRSENNE